MTVSEQVHSKTLQCHKSKIPSISDQINGIITRMLPDDTIAKRRKPEILADKCKGCMLCIKQCPTDAITGERKIPHIIDTQKCTDCGECAKICKFGAIVEYASDKRPEHILDEVADAVEYQIGENCTGCTICAQNCPVSAIPLKPYRRHCIDTSVCYKCDVCRQHCPNGAIVIAAVKN